MTTDTGIPHDSVLVTGAGGFIGSHVVDALLAAGVRVTGFDNFCDFYSPARKRENLHRAASHPACTIISGDIRDGDVLRETFAASHPTAVIHLAAMAGVRPSIERPALYASVNVEGTAQVLQACTEVGCNTLLFASSSSVYGDGARTPFSETDSVTQPVSPYAATKVAGEMLCHTWHHLHGMSITCLRFFTVYGPRQRPDLAISRFMTCAREGTPARMFGDGSSSRDYTFVGDIVDGVLATLRRMAGYHVYNLGSDRPVSLKQLIEAVRVATGRDLEIEPAPNQPGDVSRTWADLTCSEAALGYRPRTTLDEGLRKQWAWMQQGEGALHREEG